MANRHFTASEGMKSEYCCQVVRIGELKPIEGSDFLAETVVAGNTMVVRKDEFKTGDYALYAKNETVLNKDFLSVNNLYELAERDRNANADEVNALIESYEKASEAEIGVDDREKTADKYMALAKSKVGFFNKHGRVKMIRLRKVPSFGFLFHLETLAKWKPSVAKEDLSQYIVNEEMGVGMDFDTVDGEKFIEVYVPFVPETRERSVSKKKQKKVDRFDRMIPGEFMLHYDSMKLNDNIWRIKPDDMVAISLKVHGTSANYGRVKVKNPIKLPIHKWLWNKLVDITGLFKEHRITDFNIEYGNVYSSRTVIKNKYINKSVNGGFYGEDVWGEYNELLKDYISDGMQVYGEIAGYLTNSQTMIQKGYDYGCKTGENFFMPYRITTMSEDGKKYEWNVQDVYDWTVKLITEHPELASRIKPIPILYHGTLANLYPDIDTAEHWHENVLQAMKNDTTHFGMEKNEPLCNKKVPREGICIRIDNDPVSENFKLKTNAFFEREKKAIDSGEVDIEMTDAYTDNVES